MCIMNIFMYISDVCICCKVKVIILWKEVRGLLLFIIQKKTFCGLNVLIIYTLFVVHWFWNYVPRYCFVFCWQGVYVCMCVYAFVCVHLCVCMCYAICVDVLWSLMFTISVKVKTHFFIVTVCKKTNCINVFVVSCIRFLLLGSYWNLKVNFNLNIPYMFMFISPSLGAWLKAIVPP